MTLDKGRNYILRRIEGKHYIFITDEISYNNNGKFYLSIIKDISYVDGQRKTLWKFFFEAAAAGLVIVAFFTGIMGKIILKPVYNLISVSKEIAAGKIQERVKVSSRDEIGVLSSQFNAMAQEVERRIGELEDETKRKQRFIDNLAHEIRTPLTSIIGYADLVMNVKYDQDLFYKSLGYIKSEGMRMLKMANSLMNIILLRENKLEFSKYDTSKIKEDICSIMAFKAEQKGIQLKTMGEDYEIYTDANLLEEVITNLVDNSINACKDNGCVIIGTDFAEDKGYLYVKDNGRGMARDEIEKIFEPFYRIDKARSRKDGGAGLGMSICIEIIEKLNGKILIESDLSEGTNIKILL
jgi:signal transduction histidine kinase